MLNLAWDACNWCNIKKLEINNNNNNNNIIIIIIIKKPHCHSYGSSILCGDIVGIHFNFNMNLTSFGHASYYFFVTKFFPLGGEKKKKKRKKKKG